MKKKKDKTTNNEEKYHKPGFDNRIGYNKLLDEYLLELARQSAIQNPWQWYSLLRGMYSATAPFIRSENKVSILSKFKNIQSSIKIISNTSVKVIGISKQDVLLDLMEVQDEFYESIKDLLYPTRGSEDEGGLGLDEFARLSAS